MKDEGIRRIPVVGETGQLLGVLSVANVAKDRVAGNQRILNVWVNYLAQCHLIKIIRIGSRRYHIKTATGQKFHDVLKLYPYLGPLFEDLSYNRRHKSEDIGMVPNYVG